MNSCLWKAVGFLEISYNKVEKENADLKRKMRVKKIVLVVNGCICPALGTVGAVLPILLQSDESIYI
ncbi:hypothetical protein BEQ56_01415 [Anaerolineaceae bacterium oral taxon 439]|nr:hypothetical protein BEQ56_01415 [Anaerolineaceae bacterium oral taxon 439]